MITYGLTGSIACGKSTVSEYLIKQGYVVLDSDQIVENAYRDEVILKQIHDAFKTTSKKEISKIAFNDQSKLKILEGIIHPYVIEELKKGKEKYCDLDFIFLDIPLLFESNLEYLCDKIIVVYLNYENQVKRLTKRDNISCEYASKKIQSQLSVEYKKERADIVIDNNGSHEDLINEVKNMLERIKENEDNDE